MAVRGDGLRHFGFSRNSTAGCTDIFVDYKPSDNDLAREGKATAHKISLPIIIFGFIMSKANCP
jgi:hypothetical protein